MTESRDETQGMRRRSFLGLLGAGAAGVAVGAGGIALASAATADPVADPVSGTGSVGSATVPFSGPHQAGIATAPQARAEFIGLSLAPDADRAAVRELMQRWTPLAAALCAGAEHADDPVPQLAADPSSLTITVGFGPGLFDAVGLADQRPAGVADLVAFNGDELDPAWSGGDLLLQIRADDSLAVSHAATAMLALAAPTATVRWRQQGFAKAAGVSPGATTRNLMGQKDGTANDPADSDRFAATVWASGAEYPQWYAGGTTLVLRRIRMDLAGWGAAPERTRDRVLGRHIDSGAPLGEDDEFAAVPLTAQHPDGSLVIPSSSHVRIAHPDSNRGARMVRRSYSYLDGDEAGLLFVALQADATRGFIPVMSRMAVGDDMNRFVTHIGSAVFALPPGVEPGEYWGQTLLG